MSAKEKDPDAGTNRLLGVVVVIALLFGVWAYYCYLDNEAARSELQDAITDYESMGKLAKELVRLHKVQGEQVGNVNRGDPVVYLTKTFPVAGVPEDRFTPKADRATEIGTWKEEQYKVEFQEQKDSPISRTSLVQALQIISQQRPDLKTRSLEFKFAGMDFSRVIIGFSRFERSVRK